MLGLLAAGPLTSSELVAQGGFSPASLYLNMKALKKDGLVETSRNGRNVSISLTASGSEAASAEPPVTQLATKPAGAKRGRKAGSVNKKMSAKKAGGGAPQSLSSALETLNRLLTPVDRADEKIMVLGQLARTMPAPVASVLEDIMADLGRLSAGVA